MKEALSSSGTSVLTRAARHKISEDIILHSHRLENLKSYTNYESFCGVERGSASLRSFLHLPVTPSLFGPNIHLKMRLTISVRKRLNMSLRDSFVRFWKKESKERKESSTRLQPLGTYF
jgi:hypothetical protein